MLNSFALVVVPFITQLIIRFIYFTSKKSFTVPKKLDDEPIIIAAWHGELIFPPIFYRRILRPKGNLNMMISQHKDGEYIAKTFSYFDLSAIRGSSSRGGIKVLLKAIKLIQNGEDIAITPDGPRGPRHKVQDGIFAVAKKTKAKIVAIRIEADRYWQFKSWDKFILPKPFSNITFHVSEPFCIHELDKEDAKKLVYEKLC